MSGCCWEKTTKCCCPTSSSSSAWQSSWRSNNNESKNKWKQKLHVLLTDLVSLPACYSNWVCYSNWDEGGRGCHSFLHASLLSFRYHFVCLKQDSNFPSDFWLDFLFVRVIRARKRGNCMKTMRTRKRERKTQVTPTFDSFILNLCPLLNLLVHHLLLSQETKIFLFSRVFNWN